jgi:hypothetical protein
VQFTELDQKTTDIDWFAVDAAGHDIHFASCGGKLPNSAASSQAALAHVTRYLRSLPALVPAAAIQIEKGLDKGGDYSSFITYACRGIYSFNKIDAGHTGDPYYHLLAAPLQILRIADLPPEIAAILTHTYFPFAIAGLSTINSNTIR